MVGAGWVGCITRWGWRFTGPGTEISMRREDGGCSKSIKWAQLDKRPQNEKKEAELHGPVSGLRGWKALPQVLWGNDYCWYRDYWITQFGVDQTMQIYGNLEHFPLIVACLGWFMTPAVCVCVCRSHFPWFSIVKYVKLIDVHLLLKGFNGFFWIFHGGHHCILGQVQRGPLPFTSRVLTSLIVVVTPGIPL